MNIKFKVGDRVRASGTDKDNIYTGTVVNISENRLYIKRDDGKDDDWACKIENGRVCSANGMWDKKTYLELLSKSKEKGTNKMEIVYPREFTIKYGEGKSLKVEYCEDFNATLTTQYGSKIIFDNIESLDKFVKVLKETSRVLKEKRDGAKPKKVVKKVSKKKGK